MSSAANVDIKALHMLRKSRKMCLDALLGFRDSNHKTVEDCQHIQKVLDTYVHQVAEPLSIAFDKKMQKIVPQLNAAVSEHEKKSGKPFSQKSIEKALLNQSENENLNHLFHSFYEETVSPKTKLDKEIKALLKIREGIGTLEKKLQS